MFETLPSLNNCSPLVLDPGKHLTCLPVSSLPLSHLVSMLWLVCLSQRQIWSHLSSLKSLWCPFIVLVMKPKSLNWLTRPVVNGAFLATLSTLYSPSCAQCSILKKNPTKRSSHKRQHFLPLSLSGLFTYFSFCGSSCALFLLPPSYPFFFPSLLPNNTRVSLVVCYSYSSLRSQYWHHFLWKAFPTPKVGVLALYLPIAHYCVPRV